jgi:hypothetical protein
MIARRRESDPSYRPPRLLGLLTWMFLDGGASGALRGLAVKVLKSRS